MSSLEGRITAIEKEIAAQKATRMRSSAEMTTLTRSATVQPTVVGAQIQQPGQAPVNTIQGKKMGCVKITLAETGFVSIALSSGYSGRKFRQYIYAESGSVWIYKYWIYEGTQADINYCHGDPNTELNINMGLEITATSDFDFEVYQEDT